MSACRLPTVGRADHQPAEPHLRPPAGLRVLPARQTAAGEREPGHAQLAATAADPAGAISDWL